MMNGNDEIYEPGEAETADILTVLWSKDLKAAAAALMPHEARYLTDAYYQIQNWRIRANNQARAASENEEPNQALLFVFSQQFDLEKRIKTLLDYYSKTRPEGLWLRAIVGIGPVIAAGIISHVDVERTKSQGCLMSFAGLIPGQKWAAGQKRPFNARLKVLLAFKAGESFVKTQNNKNAYYGKRYAEWKKIYMERNESGGFAERAAEVLAAKSFREDTTAKACYAEGKFPPAHIHAMARRKAVSLFVTHIYDAFHWLKYQQLPPSPFAIGILGHKDYFPPPHLSELPGMGDALRAAGRIR